MTQDEIIWQNEVLEMARQTLSKDIDGLWLAGTPDLEAFAKLVEERTAAKEREACLKICEAQASTNYWEGADVCAEAIRARGQT